MLSCGTHRRTPPHAPPHAAARRRTPPHAAARRRTPPHAAAQRAMRHQETVTPRRALIGSLVWRVRGIWLGLL